MSHIIKLFLGLFFVQQTLAYTPQEGNVTATLGPFLYKSDFEDTPSGAHSATMTGFGLVALGDLNGYGSLEIGMYDFHKLYLRQRDGKYIVEKKEIIHITMGYRYWINPYFSTSLTFYSSYSLGDPKLIHSDFVPGTEIDSSARDTTEYGFDLAIQGDLWSSEQWTAIAEARYSLSVTSKEQEKSNHYALMIGARYLVQEKYAAVIPKKK